MYKTGPGNASTSRRVAVAAKRAQSRNQMFGRQREMSSEPEKSPSSQSPITNSSNEVNLNLTKAQKYYLKYLAWKNDKRANQSVFIKRPFVPVVACNKFLSPQITSIPRNYKNFHPPPNLPQLTMAVLGDKVRTGTINDVIVTRSMAARKAKEDAEKVAPPKTASAKKVFF